LRQIGAQLGAAGVARVAAGADDQVECRQVPLRQPEFFAHCAADTVARHRVTDGSRRDRHAEAREAARVVGRGDLEQLVAEALPALVYMFELRGGAESLTGAESEGPDRISGR